jgi:uracil-DNA glycosylase family 4
MIIVPPFGPQPADILLCGEAPGRNEAEREHPRPFVGKADREQDWHLARYGSSTRTWRLTNIVQEYREGNPDPTPEQIAYWTPYLLDEIKRTQPKLIVPVGRFAARWFLGESAELEVVHGLPRRVGAYDQDVERMLGEFEGIPIIPIYHPASGFYNNDSKALIAWDYKQVASASKKIKRGEHIEPIYDPFAGGGEHYTDISGYDLARYLNIAKPSIIALDTEGRPSHPWSIQVSIEPGSGYVLRCAQSDFGVGMRALQALADRADCGVTFVLHDAGTPEGCCYDIQMCRAMGLELSHAKIFNTMYAAYLLRIESKALKVLAERWCGMRMEDYEALLGDIGRQKQLEYLRRIVQETAKWSKPEARLVRDNDGTERMYSPQAIAKTVQGILRDVESGKVNKEGKLTDPSERWKKIDREQREEAEKVCGEIPEAALDDVELERAIYYAGRDSDATLRLMPLLQGAVNELGAHRVLTTGNEVLPVLEEMQRTGMPGSRREFELLRDHVENKMFALQYELSSKYFDGQAFNPGSSDQTAELLKKRGLSAEKRTKTGKISTAKKSIEHFRFTDEAIAKVFEWRESQKILTTYCEPLIEIAKRQSASSEHDAFIVRCKIKPVTVHTRRLSSEDPSLLNQPARTELGRRVRACYQIPPDSDEVLGAWDFAAQEMRVAAHVSDDKLLCKLFRTGGDPHTEAAIRIFGVTPQQVGEDKFKSDIRLPTKTANFGILYGLSGNGLLDLFRTFGLSWKLDDCEKLIKNILKEVYSGLSESIKRVQQDAYQKGLIRDLYGMVRYLPAIWSEDGKERAEAGRQAFSHVIQGTAQGMIQCAMAWLRRPIRELQEAGCGVKWRLQVHDELIFGLPEWMWEEMDKLVVSAMTEHYGLRLRVPVVAEGKSSKNWGKLK